MHKIRFPAEAPDPAGGAYSARPDPLAGFKGAYFEGKKREKEGEGRERREGNGRGEEGRGGNGKKTSKRSPSSKFVTTPLSSSSSRDW